MQQIAICCFSYIALQSREYRIGQIRKWKQIETVTQMNSEKQVQIDKNVCLLDQYQTS